MEFAPTDYRRRSKPGKRGTRSHRSPRILLLSPHMTASTPYAPFAEHLAERLRSEHLAVTLFEVNPLNYTNGHKTLLTKLRHFGGDQYDSLRQIRHIIAQHDIVHLFTTPGADMAESGLHALILAKYYGKHTILNLIGGNVEDATSKFGGFLMSLFRLANKVVVQSEYTARHLLRHRLPVTVVLPTLTGWTEDVRPIQSVQPKMLSILSSGPASNTAALLRAYTRVKQKYPRVELTVVGPKKTMAQFSDSVPANNGIHLSSNFGQEELDRLWREADLYINPCSDDDCPYGILGAFARGIPVITADAPGISQLVQDRRTGLVFPANDFICLADRIIEVTEQPELVAALSRSALDRGHALAWRQLRQNWLPLYMQR